MPPPHAHQPPTAQRWWTNASIISAAIAAVIAGIFAIVNQHVSITWGNIGGTALDRPSIPQSPRSFACFWHGNPPAGLRLLERQTDGNWVETQPDGWQYHHKFLGRVARGPFHGAVLERKETPHLEPKEYPVQTFVPDLGAANILLYRQDASFAWQYAATIDESKGPGNCVRPGDGQPPAAAPPPPSSRDSGPNGR